MESTGLQAKKIQAENVHVFVYNNIIKIGKKGCYDTEDM